MRSTWLHASFIASAFSQLKALEYEMSFDAMKPADSVKSSSSCTSVTWRLEMDKAWLIIMDIHVKS